MADRAAEFATDRLSKEPDTIDGLGLQNSLINMIKKHDNTITMDGFLSQDLELSHLSDKDHRKTKPIP